jgi:hypothetical protein
LLAAAADQIAAARFAFSFNPEIPIQGVLKMKRLFPLFMLVSIVLSLFLALPGTTSAQAAPALQDKPWCGSAQVSPPNYGFDTHKYSTSQTYWTVDLNNLATEQAKKDVETILNQLDKDQLAQTMILVLPENQVADPVNCAVFFLRYMKLGLTSGPHADNGFVWLVIKHPASAEVRYGVGLGLNALTASGLGNLKRVGVDEYAATGSMDKSILKLVTEYDTYVRQQYPVGGAPAATTADEQSSGGSGLPWWAWVLIIIFLLFLLAGASGGNGGGGGIVGGTSSSSTSHNTTRTTSHTGSGSGRSGRGG